MNKKDDVCYCEQCKHQKAIQCIDEFLCKCCEKDDRIRFEHPVFDPEEELTKGESSKRTSCPRRKKRRKKSLGNWRRFSLLIQFLTSPGSKSKQNEHPAFVLLFRLLLRFVETANTAKFQNCDEFQTEASLRKGI